MANRVGNGRTLPQQWCRDGVPAGRANDWDRLVREADDAELKQAMRECGERKGMDVFLLSAEISRRHDAHIQQLMRDHPAI